MAWSSTMSSFSLTDRISSSTATYLEDGGGGVPEHGDEGALGDDGRLVREPGRVAAHVLVHAAIRVNGPAGPHHLLLAVLRDGAALRRVLEGARQEAALLHVHRPPVRDLPVQPPHLYSLVCWVDVAMVRCGVLVGVTEREADRPA